MTTKRRHHAYEITPAQRQASLDRASAEGDAARRRFDQRCTQLLRKMPEDHAALKSAIRELRDARWAEYHAQRETVAAWAVQNAHYNRRGIPLAELLAQVTTVEYRLGATLKRQRPYIDLALAYIRHQTEAAVFMLSSLLQSEAMRIAGDEATEERAAD